MSYESASDALVDALRAIARLEVTAALVAALGAEHPAVRETRPFPFALELIEATALPAMFVARERAVARPVSRTYLDDEIVTVTFEYIAPPTPLAKLDQRWALLHAVWAELKRAVRVGEVDGADILGAAGVVRHDHDSPTVTYDFASDGSRAYPYFQGRISFEWRQPAETPEFADFVALLADINRIDGDPDLQPQVQVWASGPHFGIVGSVSAPAATDLATALTLVNDLRAEHNAHLASSAVHITTDSVNVATMPVATDQTTLNDLANEIVADWNAHKSATAYHRRASALDDVDVPPASDLATSLVLVNALRAAMAAHFVEGP